MNIVTRNLPMLMIGVVLGMFLTVGHGVFAEKKSSLPLEDLRTFTEIFDKIKNDYVEPIEDKTLLENAIRGMLSGLDPHSSYLSPDDFQDLQAGTSGEFGGLGIEVGMEETGCGCTSGIVIVVEHPAKVAVFLDGFDVL